MISSGRSLQLLQKTTLLSFEYYLLFDLRGILGDFLFYQTLGSFYQFIYHAVEISAHGVKTRMTYHIRDAALCICAWPRTTILDSFPRVHAGYFYSSIAKWLNCDISLTVRAFPYLFSFQNIRHRIITSFKIPTQAAPVYYSFSFPNIAMISSAPFSHASHQSTSWQRVRVGL